MATINSTASGGPALSGSSWVGGVVPGTADVANVVSTATITISGDWAVGSIPYAGTVIMDPTAGATLTLQAAMTGAANTSNFIADISAAPGIRHEIRLNAAGTAGGAEWLVNGGGQITLKGAPRKRWTRLVNALAVGSASATVDDATGWKVGDELALGSTSSTGIYTTTEVVTITDVSAAPTIGISPTTYSYQSRGYVGNMTSNLTVRSHVNTQAASARLNIDIRNQPAAKAAALWDVSIRYLGNNASLPGININSRYNQSDSFDGMLRCAIFDTWGTASQLLLGHTTCEIAGNVYWTRNSHTTGSYNVHLAIEGSQKDSEISDNLFMRVPVWGSLILSTAAGYLRFADNTWVGCHMFAPGSVSFPGVEMVRSTISVCAGTLQAVGLMQDCSINREFGYSGPGAVIDVRAWTQMRIEGCEYPSTGTLIHGFWVGSLAVLGAPKASRITVSATGGDPLMQQVWGTQSNQVPTWSRDNSLMMRSASSLKVSPRRLGDDMPWTIKLPCAAGSSVTVVGYVRASSAHYNTGNWTPPKVRISGLGITPVEFVASAAAVNAWEKYTLTATNTSGVDGELDLDYHAVALAVTTGDVWFSGVPDAPFVNKCRHYGYRLADESSPTRSVDVYVEASEATAAAYTGITIDGQAEVITFSAGTGDSAQKLYDSTRLWSCENLGYQVPLTRAGSLYSLSDGWVVIEPTYTGLTWGGGTVEFSTPGAKTINADASVLRFTAAGTYSFSGSLVGVELINTSGGSVTVQVPAGATYTNTGPSITVEQAQTTLTIAANVSLVGAELAIYDMDSPQPNSYGTKLINVESCPTATYGYSGPAGNTIMVQIMLAGYSEFVQAMVSPSVSQTFTAILQPDINS